MVKDVSARLSPEKKKKKLQPVNKTAITLRDVSEHESFVIVLVLWV